MELSVESNVALHSIVFFKNHVSDHHTELVCASIGHFILILDVGVDTCVQ